MIENSQYPLNSWFSLTKKWWVKILVILFAVLLTAGIWFLQPRFGRSIFFIYDDLGYVETTHSNNAKTYVFAINHFTLYVACESSSLDYKIQTPINTVYQIEYNENLIPVLSKSDSYIAPLTEVDELLAEEMTDPDFGFESIMISDVIKNDKYLPSNWIGLIITNTVLFSIAFLLFFYSNRWTYGILSRPVAVNCTVGLVNLIFAIVISLRLS